MEVKIKLMTAKEARVKSLKQRPIMHNEYVADVVNRIIFNAVKQGQTKASTEIGEDDSVFNRKKLLKSITGLGYKCNVCHNKDNNKDFLYISW